MILVTGASGLLGATFLATARQRYPSLAGIYWSHPVAFPGVRLAQVDLRDAPAVAALVQVLRPDWVVHCAALTNIDWCEQHPEETHRLHVEATRHLAAVVAEMGSRLLYVSTDSVFDGVRGNYAEEEDCHPLNVYAATKRGGEQVTLEASPDNLIVRTNLYGWNAQDKRSLAEWVLSELEAGRTVPGFYDVTFTPLLANDLSEVLLDMLAHGLRGIYHVAGGEACTKYDFAKRLAEVFGFDKEHVQPTSMTGSHLQAARPRNTSLRTERVCRVLGYPMPNVLTGLRRFKALRDSGFATELRASSTRETP